ncbi:lipopolysaccharide biosynthesis protein [Victivallis vadensis]|jgi:O-antigen/teichoic acid export membrane protein|uniref:lipopolysaccharide biosynthesis protein n=1 Tax=Victivallis vadensis TaxID=172901 RepID=UPI003CFCC5AF
MSLQNKYNKRIAQNTIFLYFRMLIVLGVNFYTTRLILNILGIADYGIYNIVSGIVVLFSVFNSAMSACMLRFLNVAIGKNQLTEAANIFAVCHTFFLATVLVIVLLGESVGIWFLNKKLNIPTERLMAANWLFQFSLIAVSIKTMQIPYQTAIISFEKMNFFAALSILEAMLLLSSVLVLKILRGDLLVIYGVCTAISAGIIWSCYLYYCRTRFGMVCRSLRIHSRKCLKEIFYFSGWSFLGAFANMSKQQGVNIVINLFCGVTVNAAMGIATQIGGAVNLLITNFQQAFHSRIIQSYTQDDKTYFFNLLLYTSKYSFFLLWLIVLPILAETELLLGFWLGKFPEHLISFTRLYLIWLLFDALSGPLWIAIQATGKIGIYQTIISMVIISNLLFSYLFLSAGFHAISTLWISLALNAVCLIYRIIHLYYTLHFPALQYIVTVLGRCFLIALISGTLGVILQNLADDFWQQGCWVIIVSVLSNITLIVLLGLSSKERTEILSLFKSKWKNTVKQQ